MLKLRLLLLSGLIFVNFNQANDGFDSYDDDYNKYEEKPVLNIYKPGCPIANPFAMPDPFQNIRNILSLKPIGSSRTNSSVDSPIFCVPDILEACRRSSTPRSGTPVYNCPSPIKY